MLVSLAASQRNLAVPTPTWEWNSSLLGAGVALKQINKRTSQTETSSPPWCGIYWILKLLVR